jgi:CubicO group peptidase (beta-lactamase class C family)
MKKYLFTPLLLFLLMITPVTFPQSAAYKIKELMSAYAENGQFNGVILVKKGEEIVYKNAFGYANREWDILNTVDSKFLIGSIGKPFTSLMTLILVGKK